MPRLLVLDESVPAGLRGILTAFEVKAAPEMELGRNLEREAPGSGGRTKNSLVVLTPITGIRSKPISPRSQPRATGQGRGHTRSSTLPDRPGAAAAPVPAVPGPRAPLVASARAACESPILRQGGCE